jgi:glutamyl-tRNA synthetase
MTVRVRFAPSPTGYLHVGGARTALFNWLFARRHGGKFILRIEDTDLARSSEDMVQGILQGLRWLGLDWDEGPFFQSQRLARYQDFAARLVGAGHAYRCFCRPEDLAARKSGKDGKENVRVYDRTCLALAQTDARQRAESGEPFAVRYLVPPGRTAFQDLVFGRIEIENETIEDFVLLRSDGMPTYHLSVVVDDLDMEITHVIRGADHISNTPKQLLLYEALGHPAPVFAHLPLILGPDRQRLSKRHGATSVMAYAEMGYLPKAFFNFLALLGWSPGRDRELMSTEEQISIFSIQGVGKANAVFGIEKLDWFNSQYIQRMPREELRRNATAELIASKVWNSESEALPPEQMDEILTLLLSRLRKLSDLAGQFRAFFTADFVYDPQSADKFLGDSALPKLVPVLIERYQQDEAFSIESTERILREVAGAGGVKAGVLINALRVALTGQGVAPGLFEIMKVLGRDRVLTRMHRMLNELASHPGV